MSEIDRRRFIRGIAGIMGLAALPGSVMAMPLSDRERIAAIARETGIISGQRFVIPERRGIVIQACKRLIIRDCIFSWPNGVEPDEMLLSVNDAGEHLELTNVRLECAAPWLSALHLKGFHEGAPR